jgi:hypothetical protein
LFAESTLLHGSLSLFRNFPSIFLFFSFEVRLAEMKSHGFRRPTSMKRREGAARGEDAMKLSVNSKNSGRFDDGVTRKILLGEIVRIFAAPSLALFKIWDYL